MKFELALNNWELTTLNICKLLNCFLLFQMSGLTQTWMTSAFIASTSSGTDRGTPGIPSVHLDPGRVSRDLCVAAVCGDPECGIRDRTVRPDFWSSVQCVGLRSVGVTACPLTENSTIPPASNAHGRYNCCCGNELAPKQSGLMCYMFGMSLIL